MSVNAIPARYRMTCDVCKKAVEQESSSRPKYWVDLHILRDAYDFQGCAVADGSVKRLLCGECAEAITAAINDASKARALLQGNGDE